MELADILQQLAITQEDRDAARRRAIGTFGFGLLGARKGREGEALGRAGLLGMDAREQALAQAKQEKLAQFQIRQYATKMGEEEKLKKAMEAARQSAIIPGQGPMGPPDSQGGMGPATPPGFDFQRYAMGVAPHDPKGALEIQKSAAELAAKGGRELKDTRTLMQNGKRVTVNFYKDGTREILPFDPDMEKAHFGTTGDRVDIPMDPFTGLPRGEGQKATLKPYDEKKLAIDRAELGLKQAEFGHKKKQDKDGGSGKWQYDAERGVAVNPATGQSRPVMADGEPLGAKGVSKQREQAESVRDIIAEAKRLIPLATGSRIGAGVDAVAGVFGASPDGADAIAQLQVLEARLMLTQPRMEGPQSDRDSLIYKQAAAKIGDPNVPTSQKLAAISTIEALDKKYPKKPSATGPARVSSDAEYAALPAGAEYVAPDGSVRRKK